MGETIVVIAIVGIVTALTARSLYRTLTEKDKACSCSSGSCSLTGCSDLASHEGSSIKKAGAKTS